MNYIRHLNGFFERLEEDERLTAYHISLYLALFRLWNMNRFRNPFPVNREEVMQLSRIGSKNTYGRCMKQLNEWGLIFYSASGNMHRGWKVSCIRFDTGSGTRVGTGNDTGAGTRSGTVYKDVNKTNIINGNKQEHPKKMENGKEENTTSTGRLHVATDKDYSEPL